MSEPRVTEQDIIALVKRYGTACAGKALHNGPGQQISCDIALSAVQDSLAAARQAAEQRAERLRGVIASTVNTLTVFPAPSGSTVILLMHDLQDALREDAARGEQK